MQHSSVSLGTFILTGFIVFALGAAWARVTRADRDYKTARANLATARGVFWVSARTAVLAGFWVLITLFILITWQVRDVRDGDEKTSILPTKSTTAPSKATR